MKRLLCACVLLLPALAAQAVVTCSVSAAGVSFGSYMFTNGSPVDSTGSVTVSCQRTLIIDSSPLSYTLKLSAGTGSSGYSPRQLSAGTGRLNYNLYTSASRATVWGDGSGGTATVGGSISLPLLSTSGSATTTVYGRVPAGQATALAGSYSDTVLVTADY